jgi:hypothetical protein
VNVLGLEICLLDPRGGVVYVAVCSIVEDEDAQSEVISPRAGSWQKWRFRDRNDESIVGNDTSCTSPISYLFPLTPGSFIYQISWEIVI